MKLALVVASIGDGREVDTPAVRLLAERLAGVVELHVFALLHPARSLPGTESALTLHPANASTQRFSRRMVRTVQAIAHEHRRSPFDVIHALWLHEAGTIAIAAGSLLRLPVIASIGGAEVVALPDIGYGALRTARGRVMSASVLQHATFVTGGSEYVIRRARRIVAHRDQSRFRRVPLPVDASVFVPSVSRSHDASTLRVLHAASLIPVKDQATLLRSFRRVVDAIPNAHLTIAGEDPFGIKRELEHLRDSLQLNCSVSFVGPLPYAEMASCYRTSDLFVLSSRHESQAMVVLEAAAAGVPTAGTAVGVVSDLAPDAATVVRPGDSVALADAIIALLSDPARRVRMGEIARQRVVAEYDAPVVCDAFLRLYEEAIGLSNR